MSLLTSAGFVYVLLGAVPAAIAVVSWLNRDKPGAIPLFVTGLSASAASIVQGFRFLGESFAVGEAVAALLHALLLVFVNFAVLGALYIAVEYTNRRWVSKSWIVATLVLGATLLPVARIVTETAGVGPAGALADADFFYRLVLALAGLSLLTRQLVAVSGVYRKQTAALLLGLTFASGFGLAERFYTVPYVEFTLLGMVGGCLILAVALFQYQILETAPVARETLFDHVSDPVIAVDGTGHIADLNRAACEVFGLSRDLAGTPTEAVFKTDPAFAASYGETLHNREMIGGVVADGRRHFDPEHPLISSIRSGEPVGDHARLGIVTGGEFKYYTATSTELNPSQMYGGQLVVFREITAERKRAQDLDVLKQVLSRVLRHNLRNEVTVIRGFAASIADRSTGETESNAERIVERTETLVKTSETARCIENVIDAKEMVPISVPDLVERVVEDARNTNPEVCYEYSIPEVSALVNPEFGTALEELVENAATHNDASEPQVDITARALENRIELTVTDNGPGIPPHELDVIEQGKETSLVHGSGAGLWLIQTAVEHSNGTVTFETDETGTTVRIRLPVP